MIKRKFQDSGKDLKKYYKHVFVCETCGQNYGQDVIPLYKQCPFCTYQLTQPRIKKKRAKSNEDLEMNFEVTFKETIARGY